MDNPDDIQLLRIHTQATCHNQALEQAHKVFENDILSGLSNSNSYWDYVTAKNRQIDRTVRIWHLQVSANCQKCTIMLNCQVAPVQSQIHDCWKLTIGLDCPDLTFVTSGNCPISTTGPNCHKATVQSLGPSVIAWHYVWHVRTVQSRQYEIDS